MNASKPMEVRNGPTHQLSIRVVSRKDRFGWSMDMFLCILKMLICQKSSYKLEKQGFWDANYFPEPVLEIFFERIS